jgi:hypothetical protein
MHESETALPKSGCNRETSLILGPFSDEAEDGVFVGDVATSSFVDPITRKSNVGDLESESFVVSLEPEGRVSVPLEKSGILSLTDDFTRIALEGTFALEKEFSC